MEFRAGDVTLTKGNKFYTVDPDGGKHRVGKRETLSALKYMLAAFHASAGRYGYVSVVNRLTDVAGSTPKAIYEYSSLGINVVIYEYPEFRLFVEISSFPENPYKFLGEFINKARNGEYTTKYLDRYRLLTINKAESALFVEQIAVLLEELGSGFICKPFRLMVPKGREAYATNIAPGGWTRIHPQRDDYGLLAEFIHPKGDGWYIIDFGLMADSRTSYGYAVGPEGSKIYFLPLNGEVAVFTAYQIHRFDPIEVENLTKRRGYEFNKISSPILGEIEVFKL